MASSLARALGDSDPAVRASSLDMVGEFSDERAARILARMLHDPVLDVRLAAARAAGRSKAVPVVFSLILALEDPDEFMQEAAAQAIEAITGRSQIAVPTDRAARSELVEELKRWWKERRYDELRAGTGRAL